MHGPGTRFLLLLHENLIRGDDVLQREKVLRSQITAACINFAPPGIALDSLVDRLLALCVTQIEVAEEEGLVCGSTEGYEEGFNEGYAGGWEDGYDKGYEEGHEDGWGDA